jgi:uncharacterized protein (TIGR03118 family)
MRAPPGARSSRSRIRLALFVAVSVAAIGAAVALAAGRSPSARETFTVRMLVSDQSRRAAVRDPGLVNAFGLAASPTGPWWTANEARDTSTIYAGSGAKQHLIVAVAGGPTGIAYNGTSGFRVAGGGSSAPARFIYASEDGAIRGWAPSVPRGWSAVSEVAVDRGAEAAVFRSLTLSAPASSPARLYATDFHNGKVDVFDSRWRPVERRGAFTDPAIPAWYSPYGILAFRGRVFVTFAWRAPVNGNDAPTGGYVDEFDLSGKLLAHVAKMGRLQAPWGLAVAPDGFGRYGGDLLVANFGDGHVNAYRRTDAGRWAFDGTLARKNGKPIAISGLWGIAFGNGAAAGPRDTLFFAAGPHGWRGETETTVHGLLGSITPERR